jgi:two-component system NarL family response regulator
VARVILADDHPLFIEALAEAVTRAGIEVVATATDGDKLMKLAETTEADAVLLDLSMPGRDGFECLELLREQHPEWALIVVSASDDDADIQRALDLGAICFVGKATDPTDLAGAVHVLLLGSVHLPDRRLKGGSPNGQGLDEVAKGLLTPRELEVLGLAAQGHSNSEIASALWVTEQTVKFHLSNTYRKIRVTNRTSASRWAESHGLL